MRKNKGISLIVLVITIIIMIVLAGTIILILSNNGIIDKASDAVDETDKATIQEIANLGWAQAYAGNALKDNKLTGDELLKELRTGVENALIANNLIPEDYTIEVTEKGVTITKKGNSTTPENSTQTKLLAPIISMSGKSIIITDNVSNANNTEQFEIYAGSEKKATVEKTTDTTYDLTLLELEAGTYAITVKASATGFETSEPSSSLEYIIQQSTTLGNLVSSAANYGDTVNYSANGVEDWKVFYKQTVAGQEYVYLIASEMLAANAIPTSLATTVAKGGAGAKINGRYIYWEYGNEPSKAATIQRKELWLAEWNSYSTSESEKCISYFLDETYWDAFKNTETYSDNVVGAIGTPTAEMFVASWNAKGRLYNIDTTLYTPLELTLGGTSSGYLINKTWIVKIDKVEDSLYTWSTDSETTVWLASPSELGNNGTNIFAATYGKMIGAGAPENNFGVRPVVCLKSSTPAHARGTGETTAIVLE